MSEKKDTRNDIQKEIDEAISFLSTLSASGDALDVVAETKRHMRIAWHLAADKPADKEADHG